MTPTEPTTAIVPHSRRWETNMDRLRGILERASDDQVISILAVCAAEARARRDVIEREHRVRLAKLDAILPKPGMIAPEMRAAQTPSHEEPPTPKMLQCPAINPGDAMMKCTQPRNHEGAHFNHKSRVSWVKRT